MYKNHPIKRFCEKQFHENSSVMQGSSCLRFQLHPEEQRGVYEHSILLLKNISPFRGRKCGATLCKPVREGSSHRFGKDNSVSDSCFFFDFFSLVGFFPGKFRLISSEMAIC